MFVYKYLFIFWTCPFSLSHFFLSPPPCSSFLSSFFSFAFASLCRPFFLFLCYSSSFLPSSSCAHSKLPLNCYFLQYSAGLLFAGQSQVNCVCSFSICFCVSDRVHILKWGQYQVMATEGTQLKMSIFFLFFSSSHPVFFSVWVSLAATVSRLMGFIMLSCVQTGCQSRD